MLSPTRSTPGFGSATPTASTAQIIEEIGRGNLVVLVDDEDRENEGDLVFAADFVTPEKVNFLAKFGRGLICMPRSGSRHGPTRNPSRSCSRVTYFR